MTRLPEVSILIVSYNTREMTLEAIRSAKDETWTSCEIIVVDNASSDGSAQAIAEAFPDVRLMAETENHGFAHANNLAAAQARGHYLLLLNPDTVVLDGAIDRLLAFAREQPKARIWGGRTLFANGTLNPASCWGAMSLWGLASSVSGLSSVFRDNALFNPEGYGGWQRDTERAVDIVSGCFLMIERALWKELGGFDEAFVMYGEEADLCLRARKHGARPRITPEARIVHHGGSSERVRADKMVRLLKAKTTLIERHFPPSQRTLAHFLFRAWPWSRMAATGVLARLPGQDHRGKGHALWREIWARRNEWQDGYPEVSAK